MDAAYDRRQRAETSYPSRPPPNPPPFYPRLTPNGASPPPVRPIASSTSGSTQPVGVGIKVTLKPEYRVQPPVQLSPINEEVPRTAFQFDFEFERRVIADAEKGWSLRPLTSITQPPSSMLPQRVEDPVISKYMSMGLDKESVVLAIASYGDVQKKVLDFCSSYDFLREMGFPSEQVAKALVKYDNDKEQALADLM